jgi:hypothetical protein
MRGSDIQKVFTTILPDEALDGMIAASGLQVRERRLDAKRFIRAAVISASSNYGGRQADILRHYFESGAKPVVRGAGYDWFGESFEQVMAGVSQRACAYADSLPRDLPGVLGRHVKDWLIADSSTVKLHNALIDEYPATGAYAALKVHKLFSVGLGTTLRYHLSAARDHDSKHLHIDESWRGLGLLADLGYASMLRLAECQRHGVRFVIRLKNNWKPRVQSIELGKVLSDFCKGSDFDFLIADGIVDLDGGPVDATVELGAGSLVVCRLVGTLGPDGYCWYLTNLPSDVAPDDIRKLYAVRWEIESDNKLDKSCSQLDRIDARTPATVRGLVHASVVASMMVCLMAHHHRLEEGGAPTPDTERTQAPIHPQMLARMVGVAAGRIAAAVELRGEAAAEEWETIAGILLHNGRDPNWRRRPSVLDQMRGWKVSPGRKRAAGGAGGLK